MKARDIMTSHPSEHQVRRMPVLEAISEPATERTRAPASR